MTLSSADGYTIHRTQLFGTEVDAESHKTVNPKGPAGMGQNTKAFLKEEKHEETNTQTAQYSAGADHGAGDAPGHEPDGVCGRAGHLPVRRRQQRRRLSYVESSQTLTLNNYDGGYIQGSGLSTLNLVLEGTNIITVDDTNAKSSTYCTGCRRSLGRRTTC